MSKDGGMLPELMIEEYEGGDNVFKCSDVWFNDPTNEKVFHHGKNPITAQILRVSFAERLQATMQNHYEKEK